MSSSIAMIAILTLLLFAMKPVNGPVFQHLQTLSRVIDPKTIANCAANFQPKCAEVDDYSPEAREALEWFKTHFDQLKNPKHRSDNPNVEEQLREYMEYMEYMRDSGQAPDCALYGILALSDMGTDANGQMCLKASTGSIVKRGLGEDLVSPLGSENSQDRTVVNRWDSDEGTQQMPQQDIEQGTLQDPEQNIGQGTLQDPEQNIGQGTLQGRTSACPCLGPNSCSKLSRRDRFKLLWLGLFMVSTFVGSVTSSIYAARDTPKIAELSKSVHSIQGSREKGCDFGYRCSPSGVQGLSPDGFTQDHHINPYTGKVDSTLLKGVIAGKCEVQNRGTDIPRNCQNLQHELYLAERRKRGLSHEKGFLLVVAIFAGAMSLLSARLTVVWCRRKY